MTNYLAESICRWRSLPNCCLFAIAVITGHSAHAQLRITEVMYNPHDDAIWEWIEVRNFGSQPVDLNGYVARRLGDADTATPRAAINAELDPDTTILPGETAIIYDGVVSADSPHNFTDDYFRQAWGLSPSIKLIGADAFPQLTNTAGSAGQSIGFWASVADWRADQVDDVTAGFEHAVFSLNFSAGFPTADGQSIAWSGINDNQDGSRWYVSSAGVNGAVSSTPVSLPGFINSDRDIGNPGIKPLGSAVAVGLHFTEFMHDPDSPEDDWEWIEIYNSSPTVVSLNGYTLDDDDAPTVTAPNIVAGTVAAGETAVLYNANDLSAEQFAAAWGADLNLVPVSNWSRLSLNNSGDAVILKNSFGMTVASQSFVQSDGFPNPAEGRSVSLKDLGLDPTVGSNWAVSAEDDLVGSFAATLVPGGDEGIPFHLGGDVGSPGVFVSANGPGVAGDFDGDGDVDGRDFLAWQRGGSPTPFSSQDLAAWQSNFGVTLVSANATLIPEPHCGAFLSCLAILLACRRLTG